MSNVETPTYLLKSQLRKPAEVVKRSLIGQTQLSSFEFYFCVTEAMPNGSDMRKYDLFQSDWKAWNPERSIDLVKHTTTHPNSIWAHTTFKELTAAVTVIRTKQTEDSPSKRVNKLPHGAVYKCALSVCATNNLKKNNHLTCVAFQLAFRGTVGHSISGFTIFTRLSISMQLAGFL